MPTAEFQARYTNLKSIGRGGFGAVYRAYDVRMYRDVAIKRMNSELASDPVWRKRFEQEATAASRLNHPNITIVFDRSNDGDDLYIVMEFVEGETLSSIIQRRAPLTDPERLLLIEQLCDGLQYAHQRHIVHRDVKPINLMVREEHDGANMVRTLKILDFGIAKIVDAGQTATGGQLLCTPNYVSPEQIRGVEVDHRSDIFAVGAVAYELLGMEKAFAFTSTHPYALLDEMRRKILNEPHKPLTDLRPDLDPELATIVDRALAKNPEDRYVDLGEMRRKLRRVRERLEQALAESGSGTTVVLNTTLQGAMKRARQLMTGDDPSAAVELLEAALVAFAPSAPVRQLIEELLKESRAQQKAKQAALEAVLAATDLFHKGEEAAAISALEQFEPATLVAGGLDQLKRAAAVIADVERVMANAPRAGREAALRELDQFAPAELVRSALDRLRALAGRLEEEERVREDAARACAQARNEFAAGGRDEAIAELASFEPGPAVAAALAELRAAASAIAAATDTVEHAPREARARALADLAAFRPGDLVTRTVEELRAIDSARTEGERRQEEEAAAARAQDAIASARQAFETGARADAIAALERFEDGPRVSDALERLREAKRGVDFAAEAVRSGNRAARAQALTRLAASPDADLVASELLGLRALDEERVAQEDRDAAAAALVDDVREQFARGDRAGAIQRLEQFDPAHRAIAAALAALRARAAALEKTEQEDRDARALVAKARAEFQEGRRAEALAALESNRRLPHVTDALDELRRADTAIARAERAIGHGNKAARSAAQNDLARFQPADLVAPALESLARRSQQRDDDEREIEEAQEQAAWEEAAVEALRKARDEFVAGRRDEAIERVRQFGKPGLVSGPLATYERLATLVAAIESRVQTGNADERRVALGELAAAEPADLLVTALARVRHLDAERSADEQRLEGARASRAIDEARALFGRGRQAEAIDLLERFEPTTGAVVTALHDLRSRREALDRDRARMELAEEAAAVEAEARTAFAAGNVDEALAMLAACRAPELVAATADALREAAREIEAARAGVTAARAEARNAAIDRLARLEPPDLFARALDELRRIDQERTAEDARIEAARREAEANRASKDARAIFMAQGFEAAMSRLDQVDPTTLVEAMRHELGSAHQAIEQAHRTVADKDEAERQQAIDALRRAEPSDLFVQAVQTLEALHRQRTDDEEQARIDRQHREAAQQAARDARQMFDLGEVDAALARLAGFEPPHPIVIDLLSELRVTRQVRELAARAEQQLTAGLLAQAKAALLDARKLRPDDPQIQALRGRLEKAQRAVLAGRLRTVAIRVVAPGVLLLLTLLAGYQFWPDGAQAPDPVRSSETPPVTAPPAATPSPNETARAQPEPANPAPPPISATPDTSKPAVPEPSIDTAAAVVERQLVGLRARAQEQFARGQPDQALATLQQALKLKGDDRGSRTLRDTISEFRKATADVIAAREDATKAGAPTAAKSTFAEGVQRQEAADVDLKRGRFENALNGLTAAGELFSRAAVEARKVAADEAAARAKKILADPGTAPPRQPVEEPKPNPVPPPVTSPTTPAVKPEGPPAPAATPADPSPAARRAEEEGRVRDTLRRYAAAYEALNVNDVRNVYPSVPAAALAKVFADVTSYRLDVQVQKTSLSADATSATVECRVIHSIRKKVGQPSELTVRQVFTLEKRANGWVIAQMR